MSYAQSQWTIVGRLVASCNRSLEAALEQAPRSIERTWIQAGYDAFMEENGV